MDKKRLKSAIDSVLKAGGFTRKGQSWRMAGPEAIVVIDLQKCDWAETYFINVGLAIRALGAVEAPVARVCHINGRLDALFSDRATAIKRGASLEASEADLDQLLRVLSEEFVPFARDCLELKRLKELGIQSRFDRCLVFKEARWLWEPGP